MSPQRRTEDLALTSAEAEVMNVIWDVCPAAIPDIVERLPRSLAYSTVMTTVRILEEKGFVKQCGKRGRAFLYEPSVERDSVRGSMTRELADRLFSGSLKSMVMNLVQDDAIDAGDLAEVKKMIRQLESEK